jgi:hypothetical protein
MRAAPCTFFPKEYKKRLKPFVGAPRSSRETTFSSQRSDSLKSSIMVSSFFSPLFAESTKQRGLLLKRENAYAEQIVAYHDRLSSGEGISTLHVGLLFSQAR